MIATSKAPGGRTSKTLAAAFSADFLLAMARLRAHAAVPRAAAQTRAVATGAEAFEEGMTSWEEEEELLIRILAFFVFFLLLRVKCLRHRRVFFFFVPNVDERRRKNFARS